MMLLCAAGQSVVQLVEDRRTRTQYAMKLFLSKQAFQEEKNLYMDSSMPLGAFLPELHRLVEAPHEEFTDVFGGFLPSCIIMEKGDTLDHWIKNHRHDLITGLQVRYAIVSHQYASQSKLYRNIKGCQTSKKQMQSHNARTKILRRPVDNERLRDEHWHLCNCEGLAAAYRQRIVAQPGRENQTCSCI
jgi:hypothetical protein